ncbi:MAG: copper homeostasis protein CutC [Bacteroidales bacterium]|nr:copper homeostasis protein CutC [Bacteroidales bacterium]
MERLIKEACVEGFTQALRAQELGADRIELCENLFVGGTTPSAGTIHACKKYLNIPVMVMIRPRGGNFVYRPVEMEIMARDIKTCKALGADGIAIGLLNPAGEVDMAALLHLVKLAGNMQITFHKALDEAYDIRKEFIRLRDSGLVHRVLSSGGAPTALEGAETLTEMIGKSQGKIIVITAGKVTHANLPVLQRLIPAEEFHGKKIAGNLN